jgi:hypothetical protein
MTATAVSGKNARPPRPRLLPAPAEEQPTLLEWRERATPENAEIADALDRVGDLLEVQGANPHRVRAYRTGARTVRSQPEPLARAVERGDRLEALPGIGRSLSAAIVELVRTGRLGLLERLENGATPEEIFSTIPGIGPALASRVHERLHVENLEDLETAAHDGRLLEVPGFGPRRVRAVQEVLSAVLRRASRRRSVRPDAHTPRPDVADVLSVDAEYRTRAERGELHRIAPRRFNPERAAWLPVLHTERGDWHFHALYSNTARAHELGRTHDWVVVYYDRDGDSGQCTVVTERRGRRAGRRVVRGREGEQPHGQRWSASAPH